MAIQLRLRYSQSLKPCELPKPIANHESSFCWIYLLLFTLSIIRSSCPHSHHWTSLGFHFTGLNPISLVDLSGWPGEGRYPKHINWSLVPQGSALGPLLFSAYTTSRGVELGGGMLGTCPYNIHPYQTVPSNNLKR